MEKLNPVRRQFPCNKSMQEHGKQNTYREDTVFFLDIVFPFQSYYMESMRTAIYISPNVLCRRKILAQKF